MRSSRIAAAIAFALAVSGCATSRGGAPLGAELAGEQVRMVTSNGQVSTLSFRPDLTVRAQFGPNALTGRWQVGDDGLCFWWGNAPRECWPYRTPLRRGESRTLTSDRGNRVTVTLL
ncbi:MAG TPA: hypothetical protein VFO69_10150 [Allosphingosinicella sp.]|nr:hypothetical protein [Allosphingosinicella sp.]